MRVAASVLVEDDVEIQMFMNWRDNSHQSLLSQFEFDLVCLIVPQVVDSVCLAVVEVFLLAVGATEIPRNIQRNWELL